MSLIPRSDSPVRVVYALNSFVYGGVEEHVAQLAKYLRRPAFDAFVVGHDAPELDPLYQRLDQTGTPYVKANMLGGDAARQIRAVRHLARVFRDHNASLVHVQLVGHEGGRIPLMASRLARLPCVVSHHNAPLHRIPWRRTAARRPFVSGVRAFVAVSQANAKLQIARMGLPAGRVVAIHNGIELPEQPPDRAAARARLNELCALPPDVPLIGAIGRLVEQKGYHWLIEAMPSVLRRCPTAHVAVIGDGPWKERLQARAAELKVCERIHWPGFCFDARELAAGFDLLAMPSQYEGLPLVLLEAMSIGLPVVAHAVDGIPEAITDGAEGYLVAAGDTAMLADRLCAMLCTPGLAAKMGAAARLRALREFNVRTMADRYADLYRAVLSGASLPFRAECQVAPNGAGSIAA